MQGGEMGGEGLNWTWENSEINLGNIQIAIKVAGSIGSHIGSSIWQPSWIVKMAANLNRKFDVLDISWGVVLIVGGGKLQNIEDSLLVILGYQLLPLATNKIMGDNKEFNNSAIFWGVLLIIGKETYKTLKIHHWWPLFTNCFP